MSASRAGESINRGALTLCVILATLMQALDTTIANVALPYMQGSVSASQDQIDWVGEGKVAATASYFPDSFVRLLPNLLKMLDQFLLQRPRRADGSEIERAPLMQGINQLAIDVELKLSGGRISNTHRSSTAVAGQPRYFPLDELSFAR